MPKIHKQYYTQATKTSISHTPVMSLPIRPLILTVDTDTYLHIFRKNISNQQVDYRSKITTGKIILAYKCLKTHEKFTKTDNITTLIMAKLFVPDKQRLL